MSHTQIIVSKIIVFSLLIYYMQSYRSTMYDFSKFTHKSCCLIYFKVEIWNYIKVYFDEAPYINPLNILKIGANIRTFDWYQITTEKVWNIGEITQALFSFTKYKLKKKEKENKNSLALFRRCTLEERERERDAFHLFL